MDDKIVVTVDTSRAKSSYEVLKICIDSLGWKERSSPFQPCDVYWNAVHFSESAGIERGVVNKFPGMVDAVKKVNLGRSLENMRMLFPAEYSFYPKTWFLPQQLQEFKEAIINSQSYDNILMASKSSILSTTSDKRDIVKSANVFYTDRETLPNNITGLDNSYYKYNNNINKNNNEKINVNSDKVRLSANVCPNLNNLKPTFEISRATMNTTIQRKRNVKYLADFSGHSNSFPLLKISQASLSAPTSSSSTSLSLKSTSSSSLSSSQAIERDRLHVVKSSISSPLSAKIVEVRADNVNQSINTDTVDSRDWSFSPLPTLPPIHSDAGLLHSTPPSVFIVKPDEGSQGEGIYLIQNPLEYILEPNKRHIVQEYITSPMLLDGLKFDLRVYVVVTSIDPLTIYMSKDGLARFCTLPYRHPTTKNIQNHFIHLTNYSLNRRNKNYLHTESSHDGSKRSLIKVLHQLKLLGHDSDQIFAEIKNIAIKTMIAILPDLKLEWWKQIPRDCSDEISCFQILGFDILLTNKCQPILLEVNSSPSLRLDFECDLCPGVTKSFSSPVDENIKRRLVLDSLLLIDPSESEDAKGYLFHKSIYKAPWHRGYGSLEQIYPLPVKSEDDFKKFTVVMRAVALFFQQIQDTHGGGMNSMVFKSFTKRCKLATRFLPSTALDIIFLETAREMSQHFFNNNSKDKQLRLQMRDFIQALICIAYHRQSPQLWAAERQACRNYKQAVRRSFRQLLPASCAGSSLLRMFEQLLGLCESQMIKPYVASNFNFRIRCSSQEIAGKKSRNKKFNNNIKFINTPIKFRKTFLPHSNSLPQLHLEGQDLMNYARIENIRSKMDE